MRYFDAHTHVQFKAFESDYEEVIGRALAAGVGMVNVGTQKTTSARAVELAQKHENLYAAVGLHPVHTSASFHDSDELGDTPEAKGFTSRGEEFDYGYYKELALNPKTVAIGECGLDYFRLDGDVQKLKENQKKAFLSQVKLAAEVGKPLMIHARPSKGTDDTYEELLEILKNTGFLGKVIFHFYAGSPEMAERLLAAPFGNETYFTFGGVITFVRDYDKVVKLVPSERILSETDAPYVTPVPHRGKRNEPGFVIEVARKLADIKNIPEEEMREQILENVERVFGIGIG